MATITNRTADTPARFLAAAGIVRQPGRLASPSVSRWHGEARKVADEVDAAYADAKAIADERAQIEAAFDAARRTGVWMEELRVLQAARDFDQAHPSRDPLYDELHADQLYGEQYPEAA